MEKTIRRMDQAKDIMPKKKRVAAYARVSSGKDAMLHSLSEQVSYYSGLIRQNPGWQYAGVFADEAISGTKENRAEFQRMLTDCREGKIDLILTKSISRFARNTVHLLETVRELKALGVDIQFERERIHTMSGDGELMLSILASFAQEESCSVSDNCKWRIRNNFKQGIPCCNQLFGFDWVDGQYKIVPEEAEIVRMIFDSYLHGLGRGLILRQVLALNIAPRLGGQWTEGSIARMLTNEKYCGDLLLQKTFVVDPITKRKTANNGELKRYYVRDAHEAIVSREDFERVQEILRINRRKYNPNPQTPEYYPFTGKIACGICGAAYRRKINGAAPYTKPVWICQTYNRLGKQACASKQIPENILERLSAEVLGMDAFDPKVFEQQIGSIRTIGRNQLVFSFRDSRQIIKPWENDSRKWSEEQKEQARRRYYAQKERGELHE